MRLISFCILQMAFCLATVAQVNYNISATGLKDGAKLYLLNAENNIVLDSVSVINGIASFNGQVPEVMVGAISESKTMRQAISEFIIDGEAIVIAEGLMVGSETNIRYGKYQKQQKDIENQGNAIMEEYKNLYQSSAGQIPEEKMKDLQTRYMQIAAQNETLVQNILNENKDNLIPLTSLIYGAEQLGIDKVAAYMKEYKHADRKSLKPVKDMLAKEAIKLPGAKVVNFTMNNLKGNPVNLTDYVGKGHYVLVDFWASWCGPCRQEMPNVKADYEKFHPKGFEIVGVSLDNNKSAWEKAVSDLGITWPQMSDLKGWQCEGAAVYNIRAIPATILFDPEGKVVASGLRGAELTKKLKEIYE